MRLGYVAERLEVLFDGGEGDVLLVVARRLCLKVNAKKGECDMVEQRSLGMRTEGAAIFESKSGRGKKGRQGVQGS